MFFFMTPTRLSCFLFFIFLDLLTPILFVQINETVSSVIFPDLLRLTS